MRSVIDAQMMFGSIDISTIEFNPKSRDDIPQLLRGLQFIFLNLELRKRVFALLEEVRPLSVKGNGKASAKTGRPGMHQWRILVSVIVKLVVASIVNSYAIFWPAFSLTTMTSKSGVFSGFKCTISALSQLRIPLDQRCGFFARAAS